MNSTERDEVMDRAYRDPELRARVIGIVGNRRLQVNEVMRLLAERYADGRGEAGDERARRAFGLGPEEPVTRPAPALAALVAAAGADEIMAALRGLDGDRWLIISDRMARLNRLEYTGRAEDRDDLDPADRAAIVIPSHDPDVNWYADQVMAEVHAEMAAGRIPADAGSFSALHDHLDANMLIIRLVPFHAEDCNCTPGKPDDPRDGPGDHPWLHAEGCAARAEGGSEDRHQAVENAVMDEVSRRLAVEAAQIRAQAAAAAPPPPPAWQADPRRGPCPGCHAEGRWSWAGPGQALCQCGHAWHVPEAARVPPAPPSALAEGEWWAGPRCLCGLPAFKGIMDRPGRPVLIHGYWNPATGAYLNEHPHNVHLSPPPPGREAWVRSRYAEGVADYLLGGDGFRVTGEGGRPALGREWAGIFNELVDAGYMRRDGGRWRWNPPPGDDQAAKAEVLRKFAPPQPET